MYDDERFVKEWGEKSPWRQIATHDDKNVKGFFGPYRFLSNFFPTFVEYEGLFYPSSENAYQAAKVAPKNRPQFQKCSAKESKNLWKEIGTVYNPGVWDVVKRAIMQKVVFDKFLRNLELRRMLLETGDKFLEETNWWHDTYWGVDAKLGGANNLGRILTATRNYFIIDSRP